MTRKGVTLIELIVVLTILAILVALLVPAFERVTGPPKVIVAEVVDKWTDLDGEGWKVYRVRTRTEAGEIETWNSSSVHDNVQIGQWYRIETRGNRVSTATFVPSVPIAPPPKDKEKEKAK